MRTLLAAALSGLLLAGALGAGAAASSPASALAASSTLSVEIPGTIAGCDPGSPSTSRATDAVLGLVLPSAFSTGPLSVPVGDTLVVAQAEVVSLNPQTVVYTLAPGVAWPDGTPFSAADLVRTWHQRRDDDVTADLGYREIASMRPNPTGTAVTVVFAAPYSDWESLFNLIVPASTPGARCAVPTAALDPSIGPYSIVSATSTSVSLAANPAWSGAAPSYQHVVISTDVAAAPPATAARLVYVPSPTLGQLGAITSAGGFSSRLEHSTTVVSLDFAVRGADALPVAVRQAIAQFIDRGSLIGALLAPVDYSTSPAVSHVVGQGQAGYLGIPGVPIAHATPPTEPLPGSSGSDAYGAAANPAPAGEALRAAGYAKSPDGWLSPARSHFVLCLAVPGDRPELKAVASTLTAQLESEGVGVAPVSEPSVAAVAGALREGRCDVGIMSRTGDGFITHEAASWLAPQSQTPADLLWTGVSDPTVSADAAAAAGVLNPVEAQPLWDAMDARLWDIMAGLPLYSPSIYEGWSRTLAGLLPCNSVAGLVGQVPTLLATTVKA